MKCPKFKLIIMNDYVVVWDLNMGEMSITNAIEMVIEKISKITSLAGRAMIYRDSDMRYTQVLLDKNGKFYGFEFGINRVYTTDLLTFSLDELQNNPSVIEIS